MRKVMVICFLTVGWLGIIAGCGQSSIAPEEGRQPQYISYHEKQRETEDEDGFPVRPGREQNIFEESGSLRNIADQSDRHTEKSNERIHHRVIQELLQETNKIRAAHDLAPLVFDEQLAELAQKQAESMAMQQQEPTSAEQLLRSAGITYTKQVQTSIANQQSPEEVVRFWNSNQRDRASILDPVFTHVGVGYVADGHYWVQLYIAKTNQVAERD